MRGARRWVISSSTPHFYPLNPQNSWVKVLVFLIMIIVWTQATQKYLFMGFFETFPVFIKFFFHRFLIVLSGLSPNWGKYKSSIFNFYHINIIIVYTMLVCLFVSNKRQNGYTDRAQILCGTSRDSREGLWMIKIS